VRRKREDFRYPSDMTAYTRRALAIVLVVIALGVLAVVVLVMR